MSTNLKEGRLEYLVLLVAIDYGTKHLPIGTALVSSEEEQKFLVNYFGVEDSVAVVDAGRQEKLTLNEVQTERLIVVDAIPDDKGKGKGKGKGNGGDIAALQKENAELKEQLRKADALSFTKRSEAVAMAGIQKELLGEHEMQTRSIREGGNPDHTSPFLPPLNERPSYYPQLLQQARDGDFINPSDEKYEDDMPALN